MSEINSPLFLSGSLETKKLSGVRMPSRISDYPTPEKTSAELLNECCKKYGLTYTLVPGDGSHRKLVHLKDRDGVITTGVGSTMREAVLNATSKLEG